MTIVVAGTHPSAWVMGTAPDRIGTRPKPDAFAESPALGYTTDAMGHANRRFEKAADLGTDEAPYGFPGGVQAWMKRCRDQARRQLAASGLQNVEQDVKIVARFYSRSSAREYDLDNASLG
jgi:hypothetical protein